MAISDKVRKGLWGRSGNRCAICRQELVLEKDEFDSQLNIGEECHIISRQPLGPRHQKMKDFDYDSGDNLLLLCRNHHKQIDEQIEKFQIEVVKQIKADHEKWVSENLDDITEIKSSPQVKKSVIDSLIALLSEKHDSEMNTSKSMEILHSSKGLEIALDEVKSIKTHIEEAIKRMQASATGYNFDIKDNPHRIVNIRFRGFTFLSQFYQAYSNSASNSYLLFAILKGHFNDNGYADPLDRPVKESIIRLNFDYDKNGEFGWRDKEDSAQFYNSIDITDRWLEKFFKRTIE
jgi:hypothetical protein